MNEEITQQPAEQQVQQTEQPTQPAQRPGEDNFKKLRERLERLDQENQQLRKEQLSKQYLPQQPEEDIDTFGEILEGKDVGRIEKRMAKKFDAMLQAKEQEFNQKLEYVMNKTKYTDMDSTIRDNVDSLVQDHPDIADALRSMPEGPAKERAAYSMIKKLYPTKEDPYKKDKERIHQNMQKPQIPAPTSPLAYANDTVFDTAARDRIWQDMMRKRKKVDVL